MGLRHTRMRGKVRIHGRPKEQAKAEIMLMKAEEGYEGRKRRRILFTILDLIIVAAFILAIYSVYITNYTNAIYFLIIGAIPLAYFIVRRIIRNKKKEKKE